MKYLSGYNIIKKIGSGGMGDVFLAKHEVLETKVAIKSLHANLVADEVFKKRFRTEAKVHAKLDHTNVVKLIDFQEREDGLFIIMEYVEGKQLDDYINKVSGPIPEIELLSLFTQIVDAISHAHSKGLVHRDIKPANIIISKGKIKVLDFGIAKELSTESGLTKTGVQVGTPMYMSPEQINGEKIDKLTDIYSLGITLFYMAVGKPPYENSTAIKMGIKILSEPFPKAKEFYPSVSNKIETIIEQSTKKNKKDRYQSCEELKKDLNSNYVVVPEVSSINSKKPFLNTIKLVGLFLVGWFLGGPIGAIISLIIAYSFGFIKVTKKNIIIGSIIALLAFLFSFIYDDLTSTPISPTITKTEINKKIIEEEIEDYDSYEETPETIKKTIERRVDPLVGCISGDCENGQGTYIYSNGSKYLGEWENGNKSGQGTYTYPDGEIEKGKWKDGNLIECISGNCKNGKGTFVWDNGEKYVGEWKDDNRYGQGTYTDADGNKYVGEWKDDYKNGQGTYTYANGNKYVGEWKDDYKNGQGIGTNFEGDKYDGEWKDGKQNGQGTFTYEDGRVKKGLWKNDKFLRNSKKSYKF